MRITNNPARSSRIWVFTILITVVLTLSTAILITGTSGDSANAKGLTSPKTTDNVQDTNNHGVDTIHRTHCDGNVCSTLSCINSICRTDTNQIGNSKVNSSGKCYLPCLPAQSKPH